MGWVGEVDWGKRVLAAALRRGSRGDPFAMAALVSLPAGGVAGLLGIITRSCNIPVLHCWCAMPCGRSGGDSWQS